MGRSHPGTCSPFERSQGQLEFNSGLSNMDSLFCHIRFGVTPVLPRKGTHPHGIHVQNGKKRQEVPLAVMGRI